MVHRLTPSQMRCDSQHGILRTGCTLCHRSGSRRPWECHSERGVPQFERGHLQPVASHIAHASTLVQHTGASIQVQAKHGVPRTWRDFRRSHRTHMAVLCVDLDTGASLQLHKKHGHVIHDCAGILFKSLACQGHRRPYAASGSMAAC